MKKIINNRPNLVNVTQFLNTFSLDAIAAEEQFGFPAEGMLAQIALETGFGNHILYLTSYKSGEKVESKNLFNIKVSSNWTGDWGTLSVWEDYDKDGVPDSNEFEGAKFKIYPTYRDSFYDYCTLLSTSKRYEAVKNFKTLEDFANNLQKCGYATDGKYAEKILNVCKNNFKVIA